mmetsp:Transcript_30132/g.78907  ORF Transcript_30132/g.78907 Transcript_30132/m.78907 type:complete len:280 (-) Transcript_30132:64-903(-)
MVLHVLDNAHINSMIHRIARLLHGPPDDIMRPIVLGDGSLQHGPHGAEDGCLTLHPHRRQLFGALAAALVEWDVDAAEAVHDRPRSALAERHDGDHGANRLQRAEKHVRVMRRADRGQDLLLEAEEQTSDREPHAHPVHGVLAATAEVPALDPVLRVVAAALLLIQHLPEKSVLLGVDRPRKCNVLDVKIQTVLGLLEQQVLVAEAHVVIDAVGVLTQGAQEIWQLLRADEQAYSLFFVQEAAVRAVCGLGREARLPHAVPRGERVLHAGLGLRVSWEL